MPLLSRILGWSPPDNEEYVEVTVASDALLSLQNPTFHISDPSPMKGRPGAATGHFQSTSPASSTSPLSTDGEFPGGKLVERNGKRADASWVARPRNEFILFRCDYVRKHSREGKRVRRAPGAEAEKTLSKQAAEAWHHLPPDERLYWKERASGERNEHARQHPNYRYRPKKSGAGRRRQTRSSPTKVVGSLDNGPGVASTSSSSPSLTPEPCASDLSANMARNRGSSSVPELTATDPVNRRLRSTASHSWITSSGSRFGSLSVELTPIPLRLQNAPSFNDSTSSTPQRSIETQSTDSSFLNWNGERMAAATAHPTQHLSSTPVSLVSEIEIANGPLFTELSSGGNPIFPSQLFVMDNTMNHGDIWMPQMQNYPGDVGTPQSVATSDTFDANGIQVRGDCSIPHTTAGSAVYDSRGQVHMPDLVDYGLNSPESVSIDFRGDASSSPEALFLMDPDELFNLSY